MFSSFITSLKRQLVVMKSRSQLPSTSFLLSVKHLNVNDGERQSIMERCFASRKLAKAKCLKIHEVATRYDVKV